MGGVGGGRLFEGGRLLTFSAFGMGAYSRWALIRGWALIRINTVFCKHMTFFGALSLIITLVCGEGRQPAKKVVFDSPGLVDFSIGLVNSVFNLPDG